MKNFLIADDHTVVRHGISLIIDEIYPGANIIQIGTLSDVLEVLRIQMMDLLVLDIVFPEGNSLTVLQEAKLLQPDLKILIFSAHDEEHYAVRFMNAGADGFLSKLSDDVEIKNAIRLMMDTGRFVSQNIRDRIIDSFMSGTPVNPIEKLSNKELEIANLLISGLGNLEISNTLDIQKSTVSTYKKRIFEKLKINNVVSLLEVFKDYQIK